MWDELGQKLLNPSRPAHQQGISGRFYCVPGIRTLVGWRTSSINAMLFSLSFYQGEVWHPIFERILEVNRRWFQSMPRHLLASSISCQQFAWNCDHSRAADSIVFYRLQGFLILFFLLQVLVLTILEGFRMWILVCSFDLSFAVLAMWWDDLCLKPSFPSRICFVPYLNLLEKRMTACCFAP